MKKVMSWVEGRKLVKAVNEVKLLMLIEEGLLRLSFLHSLLWLGVIT